MKDPSTHTSFPRRAFHLKVRFDNDHRGPHLISFPLRRTKPAANCEPDDGSVNVDGEQVGYRALNPAHATPSGSTAAPPVTPSHTTAPTSGHSAGSAMPSSSAVSSLSSFTVSSSSGGSSMSISSHSSFMRSQSHTREAEEFEEVMSGRYLPYPLLTLVAPQQDEAEHDPFAKPGDKQFYGKDVTFYYYRWKKRGTVHEPPADATIEINDGTIFIHWDPSTSKAKAWIWERSMAGLGEGYEWIPLKEREKRVFPHGTYYFVMSSNGHPRWITKATLRKQKYRLTTSSHEPTLDSGGD